ncbi:hypothetical protein HPB52_000632 [Rhipicephalus sanguineus]|uniref:Uncharacterized protein n=1 Tax=Rhipicephalus sanguineus TaxID=34632 RepID=A0A9D4T568_RHISA|nr:hypothetical protein HPB52_000632 [Rhipicephalus sanguineus]
MTICAVVGCSNRSKSCPRKDSANTSRLPKAVKWQDARTKALSSKRRSLWLARIKRADLKGDSHPSRPARLHQETHLDWAPTLLLGYTRKSEGIARYEHAARRRTKRPTPEVDAGTTAPSKISGFAATSPENCCDDGDNGTHSEDSPPLLQAECEIQAAENESGVAVQAEMSMADVAALELQCTMLNDNLYALREYIDKLEWTEAAFRESLQGITFMLQTPGNGRRLQRFFWVTY